jgi:hypothetical protein
MHNSNPQQPLLGKAMARDGTELVLLNIMKLDANNVLAENHIIFRIRHAEVESRILS